MKTAIIAGAGPAGLTAALYLLQKTDIHPIVIEKDDSIGGIAKTVNFNGNRMDIGGHRFFTKNKQIADLWKKLCPLIEENKDCENVMLKKKRVSNILYNNHLFSYPVSMSFDTFAGLGLLKTIQISSGYLLSTINKREEKTLEDFMVNRFGKPLYKTFFKNYTKKVWGRNPSEISADWGNQRIKGLSLSKALKKACHIGNIKETSLIDEFYYPKYGPGEMWNVMEGLIKSLGGEIITDSEVVKVNIDNYDHSVKSVVYKAKKDNNKTTKINVDYFFSSIPIPELINMLPEESVPNGVKFVANNLPFRDFITVGVLLDKDKLFTGYFSPSRYEKKCKLFEKNNWVYVQEPSLNMGRIQVFNNWSHSLVDDNKKNLWLGLEYFCQENDSMWNMSSEAFENYAVSELDEIAIGASEAVIEKHLIKMPKAYPAYFGTYKDFDVVKRYLNGIANLFCIGRNGQHRYNNMDHSMLTAIEAVGLIVKNNPNKQSLWNVNAELDYHEA